MIDKVTKDNVERWANMLERDLKELKEFCDAFSRDNTCFSCPLCSPQMENCMIDDYYQDFMEHGKWDLMALITKEEEEV